MSRKSVHQITMSRQEIAAATRKGANRGALATPMTAAELEAYTTKQREEMRRIVAGKTKTRRTMKRIEQTAQRRLYQELIPKAMREHGGIAWALDLVYAIPNFNVHFADQRLERLMIQQSKRYHDEGMKGGMPDNHVPVASLGLVRQYASLYLELKGEAYPSEAQRDRFPKLAMGGNAVVTLRIPDADLLAETAIECIVAYLTGDDGFFIHGHPKFTYIHGNQSSLADLDL